MLAAIDQASSGRQVVIGQGLAQGGFPLFEETGQQVSRHFRIVGQFGALQQVNADLFAVAGVVLPTGELHKASAAKGFTIAHAEVP